MESFGCCLTEIAFVLENVSLFIASPLIAPLALLGWGASLGAMTGATVGTKIRSKKNNKWFSDLIKDAISNGQVVLVIKTISIQETKQVKEVIQAAVGNYSDVNAT